MQGFGSEHRVRIHSTVLEQALDGATVREVGRRLRGRGARRMHLLGGGGLGVHPTTMRGHTLLDVVDVLNVADVSVLMLSLFEGANVAV